ncbi:MAG: hypothetical protein QOF86_3926 [Baekduia sp.]|nr:hypothetical protein [Baekduia sp.]
MIPGTDDGDVRRLKDFQIARLDVADAGLTCRAVAVDGPEAVLEPERPETAARLALPGRATLSFETARHPILLSGMADTGPIAGTLRFWVTDAVGVAPLRLRPRLRADFPATVTPLAPDGAPVGPPALLMTVDVSAGGAGLAGHVAAPGTLHAIELSVPGLPQPVVCRARVVRRLATGTAVAFTDLDDGVAGTVDRLIFAVRQRVARAAFARGRGFA